MACEVYESRAVKSTRKPHTCEYCGNVIPAGSSALYEHGIFDHRAFGRYCCNDCEPFMNGFWDYCEGECSDLFDDFRYYIRAEQLPHPAFTTEVVCPSCGRVRVDDIDWDDGIAECPKCGTSLENPGYT